MYCTEVGPNPNLLRGVVDVLHLYINGQGGGDDDDGGVGADEVFASWGNPSRNPRSQLCASSPPCSASSNKNISFCQHGDDGHDDDCAFLDLHFTVFGFGATSLIWQLNLTDY